MSRALKLELLALQRRVLQLEDELYAAQQQVRDQIALNQALQDRLDLTRAEALGITREDA